jgi:hypothetical protein
LQLQLPLPFTFHMSGPVPSPSMNGMVGLLGTTSLPSRMVMVAMPEDSVKSNAARRL